MKKAWIEIMLVLTRVVVVAACEAGNNFATYLNNKGVQCVIGASGAIYDGGIWWSECANWRTSFGIRPQETSMLVINEVHTLLE